MSEHQPIAEEDETAEEAIDLDASSILEGEEITLDGRAATPRERSRAQRVVIWLRGLVPRLNDRDAALVMCEVADQLGALGEVNEALETARQAFRRSAQDVVVARTYRKAALRAQVPSEILAALEGEARAATNSTWRSVLETERGLELEPEHPKAARFAYLRALDGGMANVVALEALERLCRRDGEHGLAAGYALKLAGVITDAGIRAEHLARAAVHALNAGEEDQAGALAASALVENPSSPLVALRAEWVALCTGGYEEVISLREREIQAGLVEEAEGWYDIGLLARYRLRDAERAREAFERAGAACEDDTERVQCDQQLLPLYENVERWEDVVDCAERMLIREESALRRASLLKRIAHARAETGDEAGALVAFEQALEQEPSYGPALEGAGRIYQRQGDTKRLVAMHQIEAETASTDRERGRSLRRAGELLVKDEETRDEGVSTLKAALSLQPGDLATFEALERAYRHQRRWQDLLDLYETEIARCEEPARRGWLYSLLALLATEHLGDRGRVLRALREMEGLPMAHPPAPLMRVTRLLDDQDDLEALAEALGRQAEQTAAPSLQASILERLADVQERRGEIEKAVAAHRRAVAVAPPSHGAFATAGRAFLRMERYRELSQLLEEGTSQSASERERARWLEKMARVLEMNLGRVDEAIGALGRAHAMLPNDAAVGLALEELLARHERWERLEQIATGAPIWRGGLAEAVAQDNRALACYRQALTEGGSLARLAYRRQLLVCSSWEELESHILGREGVEGVHRSKLWAAHCAFERGERELATRFVVEASKAEPDTPAAAIAIVSMWGPALPVATLPIVRDMVDAASDPATRIAGLRRLARAFDLAGRTDEAQRTREILLDHAPADPVAMPTLEVALELADDRPGLAHRWRAALAEDGLDPHLRATIATNLGLVLEQVGQRREALDALEAATMAEPPRRTALVAQARVAAALEDDVRRKSAIQALAALPPDGPERAVCLRLLGGKRPPESALTEALRAHPRDYDALRQLRSRLRDGDTEAYLEALTRAFELEEDEAMLAPLGSALAAQLLRQGRVDRAHAVCDRVLAIEPDCLSCWMIVAELYERSLAYPRAVDALTKVAQHPDSDDQVTVEAWRRVALMSVRRLRDVDRARLALGEVDGKVQDDRSLAARLEIEILLEDHGAAATSLAQLATSPTRSEDDRAEDLLQLAVLKEKLGDSEGAMKALARVTSPKRGRDAVERLFALAVRSGQWRSAVGALDEALDKAIDVAWVAAMRQRLARLMRDELNDEEGALAQEAKIADLGASDPPTLERLAAAVGEHDPARALSYQRDVLLRAPQRFSAYRAVRELALEQGDEATAFRAEAVLEGLEESTEAESYFYKQRRPRYAMAPKAALDTAARELLYPDLAEPSAQLLAAIDPELGQVFPVDLGRYGVHPDEPPASLIEEVSRAARVMGVERYSLRIATSRVAPAVELGREPTLVLPRSLGDALSSEQAFVCGALFGQVAFGGVAAGLGRLDALSDAQLTSLLQAATAIAKRQPPANDPVMADLHRRLDEALPSDVRLEIEDLAPGLDDTPDGAAVRRRVLRASVRAGLLCAGDPAVAVRAMRSYANMFGPTVTHGLPDVCLRALPFVVSGQMTMMPTGRGENT